MYEYPLTDFATTDAVMAFFKWISLDEYESETGEIESSFGVFGIVDVDDDLIERYETECPGEPFAFEELPRGAYLVTVDNNGLVWAERGELEMATRAEYRHKETAFNREWNDDDE